LFACDNSEQGGSEEKPISTSVNTAPISTNTSTNTIGSELEAPALALVLAYLQQIDVDFAAVEVSITKLQSEIMGFLDDPDTDTMQRVRYAWLQAHSAYELTTLSRYFADLVLDQDAALAFYQLQYQINHWPILPGYIDSVDGYSDSGIVHDINVTMDMPGLRQQHGTFDLAEASLGFHVIEVLIWGSNRSGSSLRPPSDYEPIAQLTADQTADGLRLDQLSNNRRREYLTILGQALLEDFQSTRNIWKEYSTASTLEMHPSLAPQILPLIVDAMANMLSEEILVRSLYPMLNSDFTNSIQSPFSQAAERSVSSQLSSIERLLLETETPSGSSLNLLFIALPDDFADSFYLNFDAGKECLFLLYSDLNGAAISDGPPKSAFEIVKCINLVTNMIDRLEQMKISLGGL